MNRTCAVALSMLLTVFGARVVASPALASCPPYTTKPPLAGRPAPGTEGPTKGKDRAVVDILRRYEMSPLMVTPPSGPAPLDIKIQFFDYRYGRVARFDFDFDGDGTVDALAAMQGDYYPMPSHRFERPGHYMVTVLLQPATGGPAISLREAVQVFAPDALDRELQGRWSALKAALRRRDLPAALECFTMSARDRYEPVLRELFVDRTTNVDDVLTSLRLERHGRGYAEYEALRTDNGLKKSFSVRFAVDGDGVWRLDSF